MIEPKSSISQLAAFQKAPASTQWIATNQGELKETHLMRALFEKVKGQLGFADKTSHAAITYVVLTLVDQAVKTHRHENSDNLKLIQEVAIKCRLIPADHLPAPSKNQEKVADLIQKHFFGEQEKNSETDTPVFATLYASQNKRALKSLNLPGLKEVFTKYTFSETENEEVGSKDLPGALTPEKKADSLSTLAKAKWMALKVHLKALGTFLSSIEFIKNLTSNAVITTPTNLSHSPKVPIAAIPLTPEQIKARNERPVLATQLLASLKTRLANANLEAALNSRSHLDSQWKWRRFLKRALLPKYLPWRKRQHLLPMPLKRRRHG